MAHYEERLQKDLDGIRDRVRALAGAVEESLDLSVRSLLTHDR